MDQSRILKYISYFIKIINLVIIMFLAVVMAKSTYLISNSGYAREFLECISRLPEKPELIITISLSSYLILLFFMSYKENLIKENLAGIIISYVVEVSLCSVILVMLNMNYNGVILLIIVDIINHIKYRNNKFIFLGLMILIYILCDYEFASIIFDTIPFQKYLVYYEASVQNYILGIKSMMTSINIMACILYVVVYMKIKINENEKTQSLNNKLNKANNELKLMNLKLQDYAVKTERMAETKERNRLAREIHDTIGHSLTGIIAGIDATLMLMDSSPEYAKKQLNTVSIIARQGITDVRRSVKALRPDALEKLSFKNAIEKMIREISQTSKCDIYLENEIGELCFDSDEEDAIYRVIQESITNSIRHGKALKVYVTMYMKNNKLILIITDNGIGCNKIKKGFGLRHMQERVELLNGDISFESNQGFTIIAHIPIRRNDSCD